MDLDEPAAVKCWRDRPMPGSLRGAHTSADSARVDWLIPLPQSKGQMAPLSCRALRDAKLL